MKKLLLILSVLLLVACDTLQTNDDFDPSFDFSTLKTFTMLGGEVDAKIKNPLLSKHIDNAIYNFLISKGYKLADDTEQPDFSVSWFGAIDKKIYSENIRNYSSRYYSTRGSNYSGWRGYDTSFNVEYEEGTLIIDIIEGHKRELIWRGQGKKYIGDNADGANVSERIFDAVSRIMATFPPQ